MQKLSYSELVSGYGDDAEDTLARLRMGLVKLHPPEVVDQALAVTFSRMSRGKKLDSLRDVHRYANRECHKQLVSRERAAVRLAQTNTNKILATAKDGMGWGIVATWAGMAFILGLLVGWQWIT